MFKMYKTIIIMLLIPFIGLANFNPVKGKYEKSKTIKKEFHVNANALLKINNKYGNVDVISWNENRIVMEIIITTDGNNENKVIEKLKQINVQFTDSKTEVTAKTVLNNNKSWSNWNNSNVNFQINYKVRMPITNQADFTNDYGTISLNELKGKANIHCDYGKIIIGNLFHSDNSIHIDYTNNSTIELINGGKINADYSKIRIEKAKKINLVADYTTTEFENIEDLKFNCDYGKIQVQNGNYIVGNGDYLTMRFGTIYKKLEIKADYGGIRVDKVMSGFENVKINSDYSGIKIGLDPEATFKLIADLGYAGFSFEGDNIIFNKKIVKSTSKYYEGYVGDENSNSIIEIMSEYGGVKFYNN